MADPANQDPSGTMRPRPWWRLHLSTFVVLLLLSAGLALANVPGQPAFTEDVLAHLQFQCVEHGWPWTWLWREPNTPYDPAKLELLPVWPSTDDAEKLSYPWLSANLIVAAVLLGIGGALYEIWRRRRTSLLQFYISDLLLLTTVLAILLGWLSKEIRDGQAELEQLAQNKDLSFGRQFLPRGPIWLRQLIGDRYFGVFDRTVELSVLGSPKSLRSLRYLKRLECQRTDDFAFLDELPQLEVHGGQEKPTCASSQFDELERSGVPVCR